MIYTKHRSLQKEKLVPRSVALQKTLTEVLAVALQEVVLLPQLLATNPLENLLHVHESPPHNSVKH